MTLANFFWGPLTFWGPLSRASFAAPPQRKRAPPNEPLVIDIVDAETDAGENGPLLASQAVPADSIGWSARNIIVSPNIPVTAGHAYGIRAHWATTTGCYGWTYNDSNIYPSGTELYSINGGGAFTAEAQRTLKFWTAVRPPSNSLFSGRSWCSWLSRREERRSSP